MNRRKVGAGYENLAEEYLTGHGLIILDRNFRCKQGEIDLIARDGDICVFVEVKYRKNAAAGFPAEAVDMKKQQKICRTADYYRMTKGLSSGISFRFDVVSILGEEITWIKNASEYRRYYR